MAASTKRGETWLVVASTGAALVNLVSAVIIGLEHIDRILFLTGSSKSQRTNARDVKAQRGFDRLLAALAHEARRRGIHTAPLTADEVVADMNDPWPWMAALPEFFGASGKGKGVTRMLYVYTGGTKDMALGCWDGLTSLRNQRPDITIEFVSKQERRVYWPKEQRSIELKGGGNHVSLDGYLLAAGYRIVNEQACAARLTFVEARAELIRKLADTLLGRADALSQNWMKLLNRLAEETEADVASVAFEHLISVDLRAFCSALDPLMSALGEECSIKLRNGRWIFRRSPNVPPQRFKGDWFEDWLFLRAREAFAGTGAHLSLGLKIQRLDATAPGSDYEIDLTVLANDQLYIGEAKTFLNDAKPAISKLVALRKAVVGPPRIGKAWLLCGETVSDASARREMAGNQDIEFVAGKNAIDTMMASLPGLVA